jgi:Glycosyltransferase like family
VIAYGVCIGSDERFARFAEPGILRAAGPDPVVLKRWEQKSIFAAYNSILTEARELRDLEALVLLHDDTELQDAGLEPKLKELFSDPSIGLAGAIGASHVTSLAWWEAERHGRASWNGFPGEGPRVDDFGVETVDVDSVDGFLLVLSPWVVEHLRFDDQTFHGFYGYAADFSFSVRRSGKRVVISDFPLHHHDRFRDRRGFAQANVRWRAKWGFDAKMMVPPRLGWIAVRSKVASARRRLRSKVTRTR